MPNSKVIFIGAGHSATDPGAVSATKETEAGLVLELRDLVAAKVRASGVEVKEDGGDGINLPLSKSIEIAKTCNGARIEFHFNAATAKEAKGVECLANKEHRVLAQNLAKAISGVTGSPLRGGDGGYKAANSGQHSRLGFCEAGGIIVEVGFISNPAELVIYKAKKMAIVEAIAAVLVKG